MATTGDLSPDRTQALLRFRDKAIAELPDVLPILDAPGASFMGRTAHAIAHMVAQCAAELDDADAELFAWAIGKELRRTVDTYAPGRDLGVWVGRTIMDATLDDSDDDVSDTVPDVPMDPGAHA